MQADGKDEPSYLKSLGYSQIPSDTLSEGQHFIIYFKSHPYSSGSIGFEIELNLIGKFVKNIYTSVYEQHR